MMRRSSPASSMRHPDPGAMRQPDRDFILAGQSGHAADVVTMFVRHDDAIKIARLAADVQQTGYGLPATRSRNRPSGWFYRTRRAARYRRCRCRARQNGSLQLLKNRPRIFFAFPTCQCRLRPTAPDDALLPVLARRCGTGHCWLTGVSLFQKASLDIRPVLLAAVVGSGST